MTSLLYIADPMCSWCYGFGPELEALRAGMGGIPVDVVVGGLRAYNTEAMGEEQRRTILEHWHHVAERSGLPFDDAALSRPGFVYDTEPACRAVVAVRSLSPAAALPAFLAMQRAFYAEGRDVTDPMLLADICSAVLRDAGLDVDAEAFHQLWQAESSKAAARADFMQTQRWGVRGFPTLVLARDDRLDLVCAGYMKADALRDVVQQLLAEDAPH
ncbi:putative protein-disulfide isomerase [Noviherbaspirillum humi]|uniref:DSBA-like thioredoxin domain-containing protein n=1 Tax=Noviherbaspirillum humi TaxID=1688639 RepID=A0A239KGC7_9BURK|nr:DsbA family protein [Noviherbaspirillum humi]SNT16184.1 putative protein-disulfide isomerase [Noviherbaspirillum humi]